MFHTYILQSQKTGKLYIGQTNNIEDRLNCHNADQNKSTKSGVPGALLYYKSFEIRSDAVKWSTNSKGGKT